MKAMVCQPQRVPRAILASACMALAFLYTACGGGGTTADVSEPTAGISLSKASVTFSNQPMGTTSAAETITVTNTGDAVLTISSLTVTGANVGDFDLTNACGGSVAAGASCTISVTFSPSATGTRTASVSIVDNAAGSPHTVSLTGTGTSAAPVAALSATSLAFGDQPVVTTSAARTVTLRNTGNATLTIASLTVTGTHANNFAQTNTCGSSVAGGANCTISVTFTPSATGTRTAAVTITDNASGSPHVVSLSGTGTTAAPTVRLSTTSLAFGNQPVGTTSAARTVTLRNRGNATLTITSLTVTGTHASDFAQTNNCGSSVAAGASCTISVRFMPSATGTRAAAVNIVDNASGSPHRVSLTGTGTTSAPVASLSPTSLDFGNQGVGTVSSPQSVTLTNTGSSSLSISSLTVIGTHASDFARNTTCGSSLAAGASCAIVVSFTPSALGTRTASVSVTTNASGSPHPVSLSGVGAHDVVLSWTESTTAEVVGYNIYRGTTSGGPYPTKLNSWPVVAPYVDATVQAGQTYYYVATAVASDGATESTNSNQASATIPSP